MADVRRPEPVWKSRLDRSVIPARCARPDGLISRARPLTPRRSVSDSKGLFHRCSLPIAPLSLMWRSVSPTKNGLPPVISPTTDREIGRRIRAENQVNETSHVSLIQSSQRHSGHGRLTAQVCEHLGEWMNAVQLASR